MGSIIIREDSPAYAAVKKLEETPQRKFKGVWIPAEIWEHEDLSWMEKCVWADISSLGTEESPCFASNSFLAKKMRSTESSIANTISKLKSIGLIRVISFDGRTRKMLAVLPSPTSETRLHQGNQPSPTGEPCLHPQVNIDTNRDTRVSLSSNESKDTSACSQKSLTCPPGDFDLPDDDESSFDDNLATSPSKAPRTKDLFTGITVLANTGSKTKRKTHPRVARSPLPNAPTSDDFISAWNGAIVLPQISAFSAGRQKEFRARCREQFFCDNWRQALKNLCRSKFHLGNNDRSWRVTVDWFLKPDSVPKLIEQGMQKPKEEETFLNRSYRDDDKPFYEQ